MKYLVSRNTDMAHDVFISYSNKDKNVADAVCSTLESKGIRCWIAPRDITPGAPFAEAIIDGIKDSKIFVLIFSSNSNQSTQVIKEVDRAVHHYLAIIPFRLEDVPMSKQLEYYVSNVHWLDALTPPLEMHIGKLCKVVRRLVNIDTVGNDEVKKAFSAESIKQPEVIRTLSKFKVPRILVSAIFALLVIITVGGIWFFRQQANLMHTTRENLVEKKVSDNEKTVVVLPFKNLTGEMTLDYLVKGQNDALTTELSMISQVKPFLRIISGVTASKIASTSEPIPKIASKNNIDYLIEGSLLNAGDSIMLDLRIIKAYPEEKTIWANRYKSDISNVFKLYNKIAGQIVSQIGYNLTPDNLVKLSSPGKVNVNAYKAYLRGNYLLNYSSQDSIKKGFEFLNNAVAMDPADPYAYTYLALGYLDIAHSPNDPGDALMKAEAAALRAISLDTTISETYSALAQLYLYQLWEFNDAERYFKKALAMNPNSAITHYHYAWALYLWGRMDEAIAEHKLAQKCDPFDPQHTAWLGGLYVFNRQYQDGIREGLKSLEIQKDYPIGYCVLGRAYRALGRYDKAIEADKKLVTVAPEWKMELGCSYAFAGHREEAEKILSEIEKTEDSPWKALCLVYLNAALCHKDEAFKWLDFKPHHGDIAWVAVTPELDCLQGDPRFEKFVKDLNLPK